MVKPQVEPQPATDNLLATAWAHLVQAYDALRADGDSRNARRALALAKQIERPHGKVVRAENDAQDADPVAQMLAVAAGAWGE